MLPFKMYKDKYMQKSGLQKTPRDDAVEIIFNLCLVESKHVMYMHKFLLKNQFYHINTRIDKVSANCKHYHVWTAKDTKRRC
jgi:hypothetical protein